MTLGEEVHAWLDATWDLELTVREWWSRLAEAGYGHPTWPTAAGGGGRSPSEARVILEVLDRHEVVGPPSGGVGASLAAPTILRHGSPDQVEELVRDIALGRTAWCQLFSEPGAGSDLASLGAPARLDGDEWVVSGQKVWNSGADAADLGLLMARTDPDQPKRRGITFFALDMRQPGVEVRPLQVMDGSAPFCEVFLDEVRIPASRVIGEVNDGWSVAQTTLQHERRAVAGGGGKGLVPARSGTIAGDLDATVGDVIGRAGKARGAARARIRAGAVGARMMLDLARDAGTSCDPVLRQDLARYHTQVRVNGWTMRRIGAAGGQLTGADGSIAKLATARICQQSRDLSYRVMGAPLLLAGPDSPVGGELQRVNLSSPGARLGGGTDEIQLSLLGERALGLPREPGDDREVPYREASRWT